MMLTPTSAVVHVMTGRTVKEKSSELMLRRDHSRITEKTMVLRVYSVRHLH